LLYQLLKTSDAQILCLIRAENREQAFAKITKALAKQKLVVGDLEKRVDVILADLEQPQLGLVKETYLQLAAQCDAIFHNAANTSVMRDYKSLRAANVLSTQTLLQLAAINGVPFHLISTIAVAPAAGLPEEFVPWHEGLQDGYQQSKWASERSAQMALQLGYPISVYRLARVVGDLQSGAVNDKDLVWNIAAASVRNKVFPLLPIQEPWTPVDLVARTIIANAQQRQPQAVLNIMPPSAVALGDVGQWLRDADFALECVSIQDWCARLSRSTHEQDRAILGFFQQRKNAASAEMTLPIIDDKNAHRLILANGVEFPEITQRHFNTYLHEAINQNLIAAPSPTTDSRGLYEPA
jgi:nonribosomal peptide synthetase MxcG